MQEIDMASKYSMHLNVWPTFLIHKRTGPTSEINKDVKYQSHISDSDKMF